MVQYYIGLNETVLGQDLLPASAADSPALQALQVGPAGCRLPPFDLLLQPCPQTFSFNLLLAVLGATQPPSSLPRTLLGPRSLAAPLPAGPRFQAAPRRPTRCSFAAACPALPLLPIHPCLTAHWRPPVLRMLCSSTLRLRRSAHAYPALPSTRADCSIEAPTT
jgi:hypothetical protein